MLILIQTSLDIGFYNILEACRHHPVEHLVYASSSFVYGGNKKVPYGVPTLVMRDTVKIPDDVDEDANNSIVIYKSTNLFIRFLFWKKPAKAKVDFISLRNCLTFYES